MTAEKFYLVLRFVIAGGTATVVNLTILYVLTDIFNVHYLISAIISFLVAFVVSFSLQKFWAFGDFGTAKLHIQATQYFLFSGVNLTLNTVLMYVFTDLLGVWYFLSQIFAAAIIAVESFLVYRFIIFKAAEIKHAITSL